MDAPAYQPFYCEENIWRLCADGWVSPGRSEVWLVTNRERFCPVWRQRLAPSPEQPVVWDYHVVCLTRDDGLRLWDLDSVDPLADASTAVMAQFGPGLGLPERWRPWFRVMSAETWIERLSSDRRHMKDAHGNFIHPPPPWSPPGEGSNLDQLLDLSRPAPGHWLSLTQILHRIEQDSLMPGQVASDDT